MSDVVILVQARMGSERLAGKVLKSIAGQPMIGHVMSRCAATPGVARAVLCLSKAESDDPLWDWALEASGHGTLWKAVRCGAEPNDVLARFAEVASNYPLDTILVRVTGDCPLIDPCLIRLALDAYGSGGPLLSTSISDKSGWPDGQDVEVFTVDMLLNANAAATSPEDREHVTPWIKRHYGGVQSLGPDTDLYDFRGLPFKWSVDTEEDLAFVRRIHEALGPGLWGIPAVVDYLKREKVAA